MAPRGEPGPTPDSPRARAPGDARGGTTDPASRAPATGDGTEASKLWYEKLWEEHQRNTDATVKFFEEEHKKNVQKFEAAIEDIKKTAEEAVDGLQSQFEGRKSLKKLREERDAALKSMRNAQTKLVAASREVQAAETALKDAGGPKRAPQDAVKRCTLARSSLLLARSEFGAARAAKDAAETAVTQAEVQLAKQLKERNVMNLLFKRKLTPEEEEEQRLQLEETRRISAALAIQRNYRARLEVKRQNAKKAERRKRAALAVFNVLRAVLYAFVIYLSLSWARTEGRYALARIKSNVAEAATNRWAVARGSIESFAPLAHDYARYGVASGIEAGENVVLRKRNRELRDSAASLESQLDSTRRALETTRGCAGDAAGAGPSNETKDVAARARVAERRADALGVEVHALRALATRCGGASGGVRSDGPTDEYDTSNPMRAWLDDPGVGFSAQVARAAVDAASVASEERVRSAVHAARAASDEADGFKIETELLRSLVDDGFLPAGGPGGKSGWGAAGGGTCWAEAAAAASRARAETAKDAAEAAKAAAARLMDEKLAAYAAARREAEARADEYAIELEALKAAGPELAGVSSTGPGLGASSSFSSSSSSTNGNGGLTSGLATVPPFVVAHPDPNARLKIVGAAKLVAAARVASERVEQAAEALRDAEARAEARRIEVETLEFLLGGNGTAGGAMERARGYVVGAPKAAEAARDAAHALTHKRLRAEEEARAQAETRAEVYRVELASLRAVEAERAKANARRSRGGGPFGTGSGSCALPPGVTRDGEVATLVKEVARLERELEAAKADLASGAYAAPVSIADAAAASTRAANEAAIEAEAASAAASDSLASVASVRSTKSLPRRFAAFLISVVTGEPADLAIHNALLERRITAMSRRMASAAGPACAAALSDAIDDRIDAERHAAALQNELDAAQRLTATVAAESFLGGDAAAEALRTASDAHRMLLVKERHVAKAALETCRSHAAAAQQRAFASALAAQHASELSERRERELELERVEDRKDRAIRRAVRGVKTRSIDPGTMSSGEDDLDELSDEKWDESPEKKSGKYDDDSSAFWPELPASLAALESAYEAARDDAFRLESTVETLRGRVRDAERRARVAPGTADAWGAPRVEPWGLFNAVACSAFFLTLFANRRVAGLAVAHALLRARWSRATARARDLRVQLDAAVDAAAVARQRLYQNVSDEKAIGTTVDELRASIRAHAALNDAIRADNDGLRKQLLDASAFDSEAHYASVVAERHTAELLSLRAEVEKLRAARLDVSAEAASGAAAGFEEMGDDLREGGAVASHRQGVFAARDAAEREAALLREEAKALREANESLLATSEKLRLENHELLSELIEDGTLTQGLSAYQAAKFLKQQAVEAGEQAAAERIVRTELARRFTRLVAEAKNARYSTAFIFLGASVAVGLVTYAHLRGDAMSAMLSPAPAPLRFIAPHLTVLGALTAVAFALWAVAYSKPSPEAAAAMTPITRVALVDEDDVELMESDWTRTSPEGKRRARRVAPPSTDASSMDEGRRGERPRPSRAAPPEERITERLDIRELQAAVVGADAMIKPSSWGAGLAEAAARGFRSPDEHPEAAEERRARDVEIARIRRELQHAKQHAARVRSGKPPSRAGREASGGESSGRRGGPSDQPARLSVFKAKDVILTEQEERAQLAAAEASAREGSLQSQVDMLRDKNELMSKELAKLRRKAERAEEEAEAARAEASLYVSTRNSPGVSMKTSGRASPSTSPNAAPAPVSPAAVKQALKKKGR
ncbi:predicted protein [Micromonas commoda]|uniref:Uncharacterized protein n=1 Tax=Micromonas commoda (strain RCC299 / NOUM17 / CCMP2709) TaxID=296587 RepID=C1E648_MICCC|nr:predicted protein [Micromonas commoda]ACO63747.1 predicted protein [Micromonas commoda]|eukprot:XP_002502489.1 predicted protein [Micromonas commoda]